MSEHMCLSSKLPHAVYNYYEINFYCLLKNRLVLPSFPENKNHREIRLLV